MNPMNSVPCKSSSRLAAYLSGVSGIAALSAQHGTAAIVYHDMSGSPLVIEPGNFGVVNIFTGAVSTGPAAEAGDFGFRNERDDYVYTVRDGVEAATLGATKTLARLSGGALIDAAGDFWPNDWAYADRDGSPGFPWDTGLDGTSGYVGFRVAPGGGVYNYGWMAVRYDDATTGNVTVTGVAYETVVGVGILAGATGPVSVPEPGRAGQVLLALTGMGGAVLRRRRKTVVA
jgi:MYXO-CTERM domain-containing protein